jgi:group I intron endonuclease
MINTIYVIRNKYNNKVYVGQTWATLGWRWRGGHGYKGCIYLYNAIKLYGKDKFYYEVLTFCATQESADYWEDYFMKKFNSRNRDFGFNIRAAGSKGKHSEETKRKISIVKTGTVHTEESRKNMSEAQLNRDPPTEKTRKRMSDARIGMVFTEEHCDNMSKANVGKHVGELNHMFGRTLPQETIEIIRSKTKLFTDEIEKNICDDYVYGYIISELSIKYACSMETIHRLLKRKKVIIRKKGVKNPLTTEFRQQIKLEIENIILIGDDKKITKTSQIKQGKGKSNWKTGKIRVIIDGVRVWINK